MSERRSEPTDMITMLKGRHGNGACWGKGEGEGHEKHQEEALNQSNMTENGHLWD